MNQQRYWFPVRAARNGWGWGLPLVWQGWAAWLIILVLQIGGMVVLQPYGQLAVIGWASFAGVLFIVVAWWKGEPQSMRDERSP